MYFFETPTKKRIAQVACAVIWCLFGAGPIFGFAALKPVLVDQKVYEDVCNLSSQDYLAEGFIPNCTEQDLKLNMMFTTGAVLTNVSALLIGRTLDIYGPRVCGLIGATSMLFASLVFIYSKSITWFDPYLVGYAAMALGGPFSFISSFQLSNAFPEKSGLILALLTGAFDTSSAVFLVYKFAYTRWPEALKIETFYKMYLVIPLFIVLAEIFIMPNESYLTPPALEREDSLHEVNENTHLLAVQGAAKRRSSLGEAYRSAYVEEELEEVTTPTPNSVFGILHGYPSSYQFRTYWFLLICLFATIQMLRLNYFVATVNSQYTYLLGSYEKSAKLNKVFDIALPLGGVLSIPVIGRILDGCSTSLVMFILLAVSILIGVLNCIKNSFVAGVINVLIFVCYRPFFYTSISDYCAKVFGFETFGTVYGSVMTISGIFNFLQSPLDRLTHTVFRMNPIPLNLLLLFITLVIGGTHVVYVHVQSKAYNKKRRAHNLRR
ncbi:uncharacterized protein OGAPODRAFT_103645 [Ogataea polymorpha]|uniref:uncharacterized protein n=1 Tax=Ogataea polymorpha TaxID=460523 RepID=UPI0007F4F6EB|nr:uncharacterized protein OGAPODRAFT_103645 [Ogataea polymorpha]OBA13956.1 hypothetical protein OGAPODRAFT_103645 [Ogataea polymorpha]